MSWEGVLRTRASLYLCPPEIICAPSLICQPPTANIHPVAWLDLVVTDPKAMTTTDGCSADFNVRPTAVGAQRRASMTEESCHVHTWDVASPTLVSTEVAEQLP
jgi:hypothetical protein